MWKSVSLLADIYRVQCISACVNLQCYVIFPMGKSVSPLADFHKVQWITAWGDTSLMWISSWGKLYFCGRGFAQFLVNYRLWKCTKICVNPRKQKYDFPHMEIHIRWCISTWGNIPKIVNFPTCENFLVYFHMRKFKRENEFPHVNLQADLWISAGKNMQEYMFFFNFHMRKYTWICEFLRAKIHAERCITACGKTQI